MLAGVCASLLTSSFSCTANPPCFDPEGVLAQTINHLLVIACALNRVQSLDSFSGAKIFCPYVEIHSLNDRKRMVK